MSRYDWERGTLVIPTKEWAPLKKRLREGWNALLTKRFELAKQLHTHLRAVARGKRNFDFEKAAASWVDSKCHTTYYNGAAVRQDTADSVAARDAVALVLQPDYAVARALRKTKPQSPKKKDLPFANNKTVKFGGNVGLVWDAYLALLDKGRELRWSVPENNHAVEHAWEHPMGRVLAKALASIVWTRGSGGKFIANNECNRDSDQEGGGGNYVSSSFGPKDARLSRFSTRF
jgi:hypothetical protein